MAQAYDVPATWADQISDMTARAIPGRHCFVEQSPQDTADALCAFLIA
ncbi:hypothetical protein [Antarctobacter heliothermus]